MKREKSCGAIIINNDGEILLIKHNAGHWAFPKGHVENNETEIETALREVKEETNLDIDILSKYRIVNSYSPKDNVLKDVIYFIGINPVGKIKLQDEEVCECLWLKIDDAIDRLTYKDDKNILKSIYDNYKNDL